MRILSRYVFREIVSSALLATLLATFVIFLRGVDKYFELLVRSSAKTGTVLWLFALALPPVLPLTVPFGVLVGILIGLGRLSTDGEITAMRDRKSTRLNSSHRCISYAVFCLKKKKKTL